MDRGRRAEGFGCKALRVRSPNEFKEAFGHARALMHEHRMPVVLKSSSSASPM